jgi:hypothetical protein
MRVTNPTSGTVGDINTGGTLLVKVMNRKWHGASDTSWVIFQSVNILGEKVNLTPPLYLFLFFWWDWSLNSELHTCKTGALPLEPHLQSLLL